MAETTFIHHHTANQRSR